MKIIDLNLLLYAYNSAALEHIPAAAWLKAALLGQEAVGLSWVTVLGFLRIATDPKVLAVPKDLQGAAGIVRLVVPRQRIPALANGPALDAVERLPAPASGARFIDDRCPPGRPGHRAWRDTLHQRPRLSAVSRPQSRVSPLIAGIL